MPIQVIMPQLGESVVEGKVSRWLKKLGDAVKEFEPIVEISTDKVDTEIPSPATGVMLKIYVEEGRTVERGVLLAVIGQPGEAILDAPGGPVTVTHEVSPIPAAESPLPAGEQSARYSPVVTRMAQEHNLDLRQIRGSGLGGRVTKKDVEAYLSQRPNGQIATPAQPKLEAWEQPGTGDLFKPTDEVYKKANAGVTPAQPATPAVSATPKSQPVAQAATPSGESLPGTLTPLTSIRRLIADHMVRSKLQTAPHVTTVFEIDMSRIMTHWKTNEEPYQKQGVRLTLTAYFMAAIARAAQAQPIVNSRWTEQGIYSYSVVNIGMAVAMADGLIVPVIKNAQDLNLSGLARQVSDLAKRARERQLKPDETVGGTITLTNHGVSGSLLATPIINQPQSAIVGVGAVQKRVVVVESPMGDSIAIHPMMYATLTFDHRVADGASGDAFMSVFKKTLETWD